MKTYISYKEGITIHTLLFYKQLKKCKQEVLECRQIVSVVINVIKLIGKQGLAYRVGDLAYRAYTLNDPCINHGNILEIILMISNYDINLKKQMVLICINQH